MDFAFFCVNFGYSRSDYDQLTLTEKLIIKKRWEDKTVADATLMQRAVEVAVANVFRTKGPENALFKKVKADLSEEEINVAIEQAKEITKDWGEKVAAYILDMPDL